MHSALFAETQGEVAARCEGQLERDGQIPTAIRFFQLSTTTTTTTTTTTAPPQRRIPAKGPRAGGTCCVPVLAVGTGPLGRRQSRQFRLVATIVAAVDRARV